MDKTQLPVVDVQSKYILLWDPGSGLLTEVQQVGELDEKVPWQHFREQHFREHAGHFRASLGAVKNLEVERARNSLKQHRKHSLGSQQKEFCRSFCFVELKAILRVLIVYRITGNVVRFQSIEPRASSLRSQAGALHHGRVQ